MKCPECGRKNPTGARYCDECGHDFGEPGKKKKRARRPRPQGPLAALVFDAESVKLSSDALAALGAQRTAQFLAAVSAGAGLGTLIALTTRYAAGIVAITAVGLALMMSLLFVVVTVAARANKDRARERIRDLRAQGRPVAAWSTRFIAFNGVLALLVALGVVFFRLR